MWLLYLLAWGDSSDKWQDGVSIERSLGLNLRSMWQLSSITAFIKSCDKRTGQRSTLAGVKIEKKMHSVR
jgi:hypothetical protein